MLHTFYKELEYREIYINNENNNYLEVSYFPPVEDLDTPFTKGEGFILHLQIILQFIHKYSELGLAELVSYMQKS